ncbi:MULTISPECIES: MoaD/ThiS family protein [Nitratireductor]|uniref:MoaD/ThiS family protein n=1 Tax=Nitratireductor TaxID=245876 RepID=UPI000D0CA6DF|nr:MULTISPECIES: MoaD/ThiS family protein [Nitratireductor]PSM17409.1 molybdopterin synthase sulfur carrier subunit [Nitratireductor sp. StC3]
MTQPKPVRVTLAGVLADLFPGAPRHLEVEADSVRGLIDALDRRWPGMRDRICDTRPAIRRHMNVFVDGERCGLEATLEPGAQVHILTAISGG